MNKVIFINKICCFSLLLIFISLTTTAQTDIENAIFKKDTIKGEGLFNPDSLKEVTLTEAQLADFKDKALRKTKALSTYISTIGDKTKDEVQRDKAIDLAVGLFMSEDNVVEVSSLNSIETKRFKIRDYLLKVKMLPYKKVTIEWFDIFFSSNFTKRPDGRYDAVASIYQRFSGVNDEGGVYLDVTKKNIVIIIDKAAIGTGDRMDNFWEIFLGDIKVEETKEIKMRKLFFIFFMLISSITCNSQVLSIDLSNGDRERFVKEVKQLDQFFKRFNNREDLFTGELKSREAYLNEKKDIIKFQTERKKSLITLLNHSDSALIKNKGTVDFINYAGDDSNHVELGYYDKDWYAKVECTFKYRGQKQVFSLTLKIEGNPELGYKWAITGVDLSFISLTPIRTDTIKFISPMNHEVGFMDLFKIFRDNSNIAQYTSTGFVPDQLNIFLYLIKTGEMQYIGVNSIQYHFLQVKNWLFTVDYFNRASNNSGWLISSVVPMNDAEKIKYRKNILP